MGQLVLEALDLIADCRNGTLAPRPSGRADPDPAASIARRLRRRQRVTKPQIGNAAVGPDENRAPTRRPIADTAGTATIEQPTQRARRRSSPARRDAGQQQKDRRIKARLASRFGWQFRMAAPRM